MSSAFVRNTGDRYMTWSPRDKMQQNNSNVAGACYKITVMLLEHVTK